MQVCNKKIFSSKVNKVQYLHIVIRKLYYIFFQVFDKWAVIADKHNLREHKPNKYILKREKHGQY